jgi:hypothetical protein
MVAAMTAGHGQPKPKSARPPFILDAIPTPTQPPRLQPNATARPCDEIGKANPSSPPARLAPKSGGGVAMEPRRGAMLPWSMDDGLRALLFLGQPAASSSFTPLPVGKLPKAPASFSARPSRTQTCLHQFEVCCLAMTNAARPDESECNKNPDSSPQHHHY